MEETQKQENLEAYKVFNEVRQEVASMMESKQIKIARERRQHNGISYCKAENKQK